MSAFAPSPQRDVDDNEVRAVTASTAAPVVLVPEAAAPLPPVSLPGEYTFLNGPVAGILLGNAITFAGAVFQHWPALPVMIVYWGQSVAIGLVNVIRMRTLKDFSTANMTSNGHPVPATPESARSMSNFFAVHFGMFHLGYALFLFARGHGHIGGWTAVTVAANVALFAGSHLWHLFRPGGRDYRRKPNLGVLMFYPYLRILPMHFAIIMSSRFPIGALPFFILLKTGADLGMHEVERRIFLSTED